MEFSVPLKMNYDFRRAYRKGRSAAKPCLVLYARRNGSALNRVGYTVSKKLGHAVVRKPRPPPPARDIQAPRGRDAPGHDLVVVARGRAVSADYGRLERDFMRACAELGLLREGERA